MKTQRKIGCFATAAQMPQVAALGFDSIELDLMELVQMTPEAFRAFTREAKDTGLGFEAFSGLIPLTERIHDASFDWQHWLRHTKKAAEVVSALGGSIIPFGAGKCRSIPEGCADVAAAKRRVADFVADLCDVLSPYGIRLAVEPLGPANSNYLNFIGEAAAFVRQLGKDNCFIMCDMRHMVKLAEDWQDIVTWRDLIIHAHIDYPLGTDRLFPAAGDGYDYRPYLAALDAAGYQGILTAEALAYTDFPSAAKGFLEMITQIW